MRALAFAPVDNKVTLTIDIDETEVDLAVDAAAKELASQIAIKGFRKGKAPRALVEQRVGGPLALRAEALNSALPDFYARAISDTLIDPISQPSVEVTAGETEGPVTFTVEVEVRPEITLAGYEALSVQIPSPLIDPADVDEQIDRMRATDATLEVVNRPITTGDLVTMQVVAVDPATDEEALNIDDFIYTVGSGSLTEGVDELILGMKTGETLELIGPGPGRTPMKWTLQLGEVNEKVLPELTDTWTEENTDYGTVAAMREGITTMLRRRRLIEAQMSRREAVLIALSDLVADEVAPEVLVAQETNERLHDLSHRLDSQKLNLETFLSITNQAPEQLIDTLKADATRAVKIDLALRAVVRAQGLEPTADEVREELEKTAANMGVSVETLESNLTTAGRVAMFHSEVAKVKASRWLNDHVQFVDPQGVAIDRALLDENTADAFGA
jgi:trigger factor